MTPLAHELLPPGARVGPYHIVRGVRSQGTMARLFEARCVEDGGRVALKVALPGHADALRNEAHHLRRCAHPHVVRILSIRGRAYVAPVHLSLGPTWYFVMSWVPGGSLEERLRNRPLFAPWQPALDPRGALRITLDLSCALEHCHRRGIVHLDLKPSNVLLHRKSGRERAALCDFGIARNVRGIHPPPIGFTTPLYASPEQLLEADGGANPIGARSDIFSLGVLLYEMLTGQLPFASPKAIVSPTCAPPPLHPEGRQHAGVLRPLNGLGCVRAAERRKLPEELQSLVLQMLEKDPGRRPQNAGQVRAALGKIGSGLHLDSSRLTWKGESVMSCGSLR
jgi:serine/threonine-protein kinase